MSDTSRELINWFLGHFSEEETARLVGVANLVVNEFRTTGKIESYAAYITEVAPFVRPVFDIDTTVQLLMFFIHYQRVYG